MLINALDMYHVSLRSGSVKLTTMGRGSSTNVVAASSSEGSVSNISELYSNLIQEENDKLLIMREVMMNRIVSVVL